MVLHQTTFIDAALVDLRAHLEAKLRILAALESRVAGFRHRADPIALQHTARQLEEMRKLHAMTTDLLTAVDSALAGFIADALFHVQ